MRPTMWATPSSDVKTRTVWRRPTGPTRTIVGSLASRSDAFPTLRGAGVGRVKEYRPRCAIQPNHFGLVRYSGSGAGYALSAPERGGQRLAPSDSCPRRLRPVQGTGRADAPGAWLPSPRSVGQLSACRPGIPPNFCRWSCGWFIQVWSVAASPSDALWGSRWRVPGPGVHLRRAQDLLFAPRFVGPRPVYGPSKGRDGRSDRHFMEPFNVRQA